jgi:integrase
MRDMLRQRKFKSDPLLQATLENHAKALLSMPLAELRPGLITRLADEVAAKIAKRKGDPDAGRHAAHATVKALNTVGKWHARRNDDFVWKSAESPLTKQDREGRDRVLEDHEIAAVWNAAIRQGHPHGVLVRVLLLTACRLREIAELRRSEVVDGVIRLPPERTKTKAPLVLPLSKMALELLASCPEGEWYFPGDRSEVYSAFSNGKEELDALTNVEGWRLHDLRRTAATLMERAGVLPHVIEATLNHKVRGVAGVYRRHNFIEEKTDALEKLSALLHDIVSS